MPIRIAHIGAGEWSRFAHAPALRRLAERSLVSLEAACDLRKERAAGFCEEFGYRRAFTSIGEMLDAVRPDAIVCTVEPAATAKVAHMLLPERIPLFIEKPPGISQQEACSLASAAAHYGTLNFVAFNRRFVPALIGLKEWALAHPVRYARAEMLRTNRLEALFALSTGIHALDAIRFLLGNPVSMTVERRGYDGADAADSWARLFFENGAIADIALLLDSGCRRETYSLVSSGAFAEAVLGAGYSAECCPRGARQWAGEVVVSAHEISGDPLVDGGFLGEHEAFLGAVGSGARASCNSLADAARSMQLAAAVQESYSGPIPPLELP